MRARTPAYQSGRTQHADIGVDQWGDFGLAFLRQHGQPGAQLGQLLAGLDDGGLQASTLGADVGGLDLLPGDDRLRLGGAEHRADGDSGRYGVYP